MKRAVILAVAALLAGALLPHVIRGQGQPAQSPPHVGYVYPAGGRAGTTFKVTVGGQFLNNTQNVIMSGRGVKATVVGVDTPMTQREIQDARDRLQEMQAKASTDPKVRQQMIDLRAKLGDSLRRNQAPVLSDLALVEITVSADAEPGPRQLRLQTPFGLSNPLVFVVGQLPEARERDEKLAPTDSELEITLPVTVNGRVIPGDIDRARAPLRQAGQYEPGDVDRYRFKAAKGQQLVVSVSARDLTPYLADAVPGWFQAVVTLYDGAGHELDACDDYRFHPDPVLHFDVPTDGEYIVEIRDAIYRGREDFVYRMSIGELPFITSMFPIGGRAGGKTPVEMTGWNLDGNRRVVNAGAPGVTSVFATHGQLESNRLPFAIDDMSDQIEREPNDNTTQAQTLTLPIIVSGRIQQPGDWDVYRFTGKAGASVVAEITARRLESPLDSTIEVTDATGRRIAFNDDSQDKSAGLLTHQADSFVMATLPRDGTYFVRVGDIQRKGGREYAYRLRVSAPRPDFELLVTPSSLNAGRSATMPVSVTAVRKDGFNGDIDLTLRHAPGDVTMSGGVLPAGQDHVRVTLTMPPKPTDEPVELRIDGRATIAGRTVVHTAQPADEMMQAFAYRHLVAADDASVTIAGRGGTLVPVRVQVPQPLRLVPGGSTRVRVALPPAYRSFTHLEFELSEPPAGMRIRESAAVGGGAEFVIDADAATVKPGLRGNLIVTMSGERVPPANAQGNAAQRRRVPLGTLPAITFEVGPGRSR